MPNPVVHWEISGPNAQVLQPFYEQLFGWKIDADNPYQYGMVDTLSSEGIAGGIGPGEGPNRVTIYVQVPDLQAALDKAESLGAKTVMEPTEIPGAVTMAMFTDPEGNVMGIIKG
ncbi:MAG TPA: VOC family protein [Thermomicrobiaceae bacterium]|nr:VOC family protein [Thermomicrobiaceae bacterium]